MTITITPNNPAHLIGPGVQLNLSSDFIGPLPIGSFWVVDFTEGLTLQLPFWHIRPTTQQKTISTRIYVPDLSQNPTIEAGPVPNDDGQVTVRATLSDPVNIVDTAQIPFTWSLNQGLGEQAFLLKQQQGGGLTTEQAQQLQQINDSTLPSIAVDTLTLVPLTSGPSQGPINSQLPNPCFGVIVRISNVPVDLVPNTPDGDYWFPSLAVVRIFRGSDLWKRVPVHTSSKLVELLDESIVAGLTAITATQWLLNLSVQVTFREGVTGEVFTMLLP